MTHTLEPTHRRIHSEFAYTREMCARLTVSNASIPIHLAQWQTSCVWARMNAKPLWMWRNRLRYEAATIQTISFRIRCRGLENQFHRNVFSTVSHFRSPPTLTSNSFFFSFASSQSGDWYFTILYFLKKKYKWMALAEPEYFIREFVSIV